MLRYVLLALLVLAPSVALAQANALIFSQRNATDSGIANRLAISQNYHAFFYSDPVSRIPRWMKVGSSCTVTATEFNCGETPAWADVQGVTSFGRDWALLADEDAAKSFLGVPTLTSELTNDSGFLTSLPSHTHTASDIVSGSLDADRVPNLAISKISGLEDALDDKMGVGASVDWSQVVGFTSSAYSDVGAAAASHTHAASDITSGTLDSARIPSLAISKVTGLQDALNDKFDTPTGTSSQVVLGDGTLGTLPTIPSRAFDYPTRPLNTCFQVSDTQDASVVYPVEVVASGTLIGGQQGTVYLEIFTDSGCTTGTQEIMRAVKGNTSALIVALGNVDTATLTLSGIIPASQYVKIRTESNIGSPSFTSRQGQEVRF